MVKKRPNIGTGHFLLHFVNTYKNMSKKIKIVYLKNHLDRNIFSDSDIEDFIDYICSVGIRTKIFYLWRSYLRDPFDDHVLELSINAGAETIVTINKKNFLEAESLGMKIQTPKEFLEEMEV